MFHLQIEKLVFGGQCIGHAHDKTIFAWNALPEELVQIETTKTKRDFISGIATAIIEPSAARVNPEEEHFLSCSPWQILKYEEENYWKGTVSKEQFAKIARIALLNTSVVHDEKPYHYRNKIEYSFCENDSGELSLAFFKRDTKLKVPIQSCCLAQEQINDGALEVLEWLKNLKCSNRDIKSLMMRTDGTRTAACLFVITKTFPSPSAPFAKLHGFTIY